MSDIVRCKVCVFADPDGMDEQWALCRKRSATHIPDNRYSWPPVQLDGKDGCGEGKEKATP